MRDAETTCQLPAGQLRLFRPRRANKGTTRFCRRVRPVSASPVDPHRPLPVPQAMTRPAQGHSVVYIEATVRGIAPRFDVMSL
jgi:hypothetical protein